MFERYTENAIKAIMLAQEEARRLGHNYVSTEFVLLGLIGLGENSPVYRALVKLGVSSPLKTARLLVEQRVGKGSGFVGVELPFTPRMKRSIEVSWNTARELGHNYIAPFHVLFAIIAEEESTARAVLFDMGIIDLETFKSLVVDEASRAAVAKTDSILQAVNEKRTADERRNEKQRAWDKSYMAMAHIIAGHSHDPKFKVGAIVVNDLNGAIVGLGYNGRGKGRPNDRLSMETGQSGFVHAEMNAIARVSWEMTCTYTLYTTLAPCMVCAGLVLNNPIKRVVYGQIYNDDKTGVEELIGGLGAHLVHHCPHHS
jgi:deoxycytidylate deaminase